MAKDIRPTEPAQEFEEELIANTMGFFNLSDADWESLSEGACNRLMEVYSDLHSENEDG